ncbi:tetratricopeptide repeat protein [Anaeromyxobacter oryzae]|uniref:Zinc finger/thioredoxin putative domain-containing protein n=1 Tax=Anaeromyxobacter oryzae TaxID=2918170 RepID=A0ABM7WUZ1_9BACT|nr:tetratricopeptide repeat protein [Anaeromyxobacter oryzae]BDG03312.1 hypothetical protein AMOR_23080 [Anaeromyxobacter oryzae]
MDVRCERCRAQYVFDDDQVTPSGLTVQCTNCGHVFRVKKKELVVTVPVKPDELDGAPLPATAAALRPAGHVEAASAAARPHEPERREWRVRQANGNVFTFRELTTLQKWIVEQKVSRDDEISQGTDAWKRLGNIAELASFFQVVEAAERAKAHPAQPAVTPLPVSAATTAVFGAPAARLPPPPSGFPPPSFTLPPQAARPAPPAPIPPPAVAPARPLPAEDVPVDDDLSAVRGTGRGRIVAAVALIAVAGGALAYVLAPRQRPAPVSVPITLEVKPVPAPGPAASVPTPAVAAGEGVAAAPAATAAAPAAAPEPPADRGDPSGLPEPKGAPPPPLAAPEPVPESAAKAPEPVKAPAKPAAPPAPKVLLAQAERLRQRGEAERALDLYGRVVASEPENAAALVGRGLCYLDLEQYAPAEASFQAALRAAPGDADALMGLAETYRGRGKKAEALQYYERYLALHPDGEEAAVARNAIEELRR